MSRIVVLFFGLLLAFISSMIVVSRCGPISLEQTQDLTEVVVSDNDWKTMPLPEGFEPTSVVFGENGEIVVIGNSIRVSKDSGETWRTITQGKGFDRCTIDGGKSLYKGYGARGGTEKINFDGDVNYNGDIRNPVLTRDGRLYFYSFYEHHGALWSIPIDNPKDMWYGTHFTYESAPDDAKYWASDELLKLKSQVFVTASSSVDPNFRWLTTKDKGRTWHRANFHENKDRLFIDKNNGVRFVDGDLGATTDGGLTWQILRSAHTPDSTFTESFVDDKVGFAAGENGLLAVTKDGGVTWRKIDLGAKETFYVVACLDKNNAWVAGGMGLLFETFDGGDTWQEIDLGFKKEIYSTFFGQELKIDYLRRTVWIIKDGKVFRRIVK